MTVSEVALLNAIKKLAVISTAESVRKTELLSMRQDYGQPVRSFVAKVKGKAQVSLFTKDCPAQQCQQQVDFTDDIVKYVVVAGIADEEIKKDVLGHADLDTRTLNDTVSLIESHVLRSRFCRSQHGYTIHQQWTNPKQQKDDDTKLQIKTNCKKCSRTIMKFKMRRGKPKEFTHCINRWKKLHVTPTSTTSIKHWRPL